MENIDSGSESVATVQLLDEFSRPTADDIQEIEAEVWQGDDMLWSETVTDQFTASYAIASIHQYRCDLRIETSEDHDLRDRDLITIGGIPAVVARQNNRFLLALNVSLDLVGIPTEIVVGLLRVNVPGDVNEVSGHIGTVEQRRMVARFIRSNGQKILSTSWRVIRR